VLKLLVAPKDVQMNRKRKEEEADLTGLAPEKGRTS
jgi:hypothetical protein